MALGAGRVVGRPGLGCRNRGVPQQWGAGLADEVRVVVAVEGGGCLRRTGHAMSTARYIACRNGR